MANKDFVEFNMIGACIAGIDDNIRMSYQAMIVGHVYDTVYMIQYFEQLCGTLNTLELLDIRGLVCDSPTASQRTPGQVLFFDNLQDMNNYFERGPGRYLVRPLPDE